MDGPIILSPLLYDVQKEKKQNLTQEIYFSRKKRPDTRPASQERSRRGEKSTTVFSERLSTCSCVEISMQDRERDERRSSKQKIDKTTLISRIIGIRFYVNLFSNQVGFFFFFKWNLFFSYIFVFDNFNEKNRRRERDNKLSFRSGDESTGSFFFLNLCFPKIFVQHANISVCTTQLPVNLFYIRKKTSINPLNVYIVFLFSKIVFFLWKNLTQ